MSGDHAMPSRDPPIRVETVYQSERTRVTRLVLANRTLIRKESLGPDAQARLCHERTMLERLRGVDGIVQLANVPPEPGAIDLDDVNGVSLASVPLPLPPDELIDIAVDLARTVAAMHRAGRTLTSKSDMPDPREYQSARRGAPLLSGRTRTVLPGPVSGPSEGAIAWRRRVDAPHRPVGNELDGDRLRHRSAERDSRGQGPQSGVL